MLWFGKKNKDMQEIDHIEDETVNETDDIDEQATEEEILDSLNDEEIDEDELDQDDEDEEED